MRITFDKPATAGDDFTAGKRTIEAMDVVTVAFNLKADRVKGMANVSITLECPETGHQVHEVYTDNSTVLAFWEQVKGLEIAGEKWLAPLLKRLIADGKLPSGTLS